MKIIIIGLSITSSWGNGHATTYRGLVKELIRRGNEVIFLERNMPWYESNRDMPPEDCAAEVCLYDSLEDLKAHAEAIATADAVIIGSYVPEGSWVFEWVQMTASGLLAFYDIDTPVTLAMLAAGSCEYLRKEQIPGYDLYLSFAGGRSLGILEDRYGSPCARPLYCSVDPASYSPQNHPLKWDLGYLGTYSQDRQPGLERLLLDPARIWPEGRFVVAGPQYPDEILWPANVRRIEHLPPVSHCEFYNSQRFTLNITRADMRAAGHSPSVRLFEAAACETAIISDWWEGLDDFFEIGKEILVARSTEEAMAYLTEMSCNDISRIAEAACRRVLSSHTAAHRAAELESYIREIRHEMAATA